MNAPVELTPYRKIVFRNFGSVVPSQNLMDDLADSEADQEILNNLFYEMPVGGIQPVERVLAKSMQCVLQDEIQSKFNPAHWYPSRYSDGTWAVLYTAEEEETALLEAIYHLRLFYREELERKQPVTLDRRVARLEVRSEKCVDLERVPDVDREAISSWEKTGYPYCQELALTLIQAGAELLRAPSARRSDGICVPIFKKEAVVQDEGHLRYLKLILTPETCRLFPESEVI